ncbi:MAG: DinB family protein [Sciscionella sp.]
MTETSPGTAVIDAAAADERSTLEVFLEYYRDAVIRKVSGISEDGARRRLVPSATTLGGLIKHLRLVEKRWFSLALVGAAIPKEHPDAEFQPTPEDTVDGLIADYQRQCAESRRIAARYALTDTGSHPELNAVSLRWIYVHLIEETARHAGHADILREQIDGTVGE